MTPEQTLSALTELIVKALSDLQKPTACVHVHPCQEPSDCKLVIPSPSPEAVWLALQACKKKVKCERLIYEDFVFLHTKDDDAVKLYVYKPLHLQPPETIIFLYSLLKL